ncbi:signal peptide peptidase SppA [Novosphingobium colocasiae]|uniref:Protease n=1 Tax=Novosphingobium colocasiae TaxID=1256513 RepID=A0A918PFL5_9SPHN|nr:signal peptide peptidase SppA [Novosphingobium colocasiae]GGZ04186.1 protease [Novosphingobium colocasiae]
MVFARKVWKLLVAIKDAMVLLLLILFFGVLYAAMSSRPVPGRVADGALLIDLDGAIVEEASNPDPLRMALAGEAPTGEFQARDVARAVRLAADDKRIKAVVLDLSRFTGAGRVHLNDIGAAMDAVRKAGKPVLTFAHIYADDGVQLAAHASEAWVDPMGGAVVAGPGGSMQFFKGLLDRFKVKAHVYRVGTYKSFVEPYILEKMSDPAREENTALLGSVWQTWKAGIAKARPKANIAQMTTDPAGWARSVNGDLAQGAKSAGLIDRIGDKTEFDARIAQLVGKGDADDLPYAHTLLADWLAANPMSEKGAAIGVITIAGDVVDGDAGPGNAGGDRIAGLLDKALEEGDLKALVVRIDSPGGAALAGERMRRAIDRYRQKGIPVIASMANVAASAGYMVAAPADRIFAEPDTITGSIGVFAIIPSFEDTLAQYGVTTDSVRATPLSGQPDVLGGINDETSQLLQASVESAYAKFVGVVAQGRKVPAAKIEAIAQGRVWSGEQARQNGLVDEYGDLDAALAYAAKRAGVASGWHAQFLESKESTWAMLLGDLGQGAARAKAGQGAAYDFAGLVAARERQQLSRAGTQIQRMMGGTGMQAYCIGCPVNAGMAPVNDRTAETFLARLLAGR